MIILKKRKKEPILVPIPFRVSQYYLKNTKKTYG
jgi:hypothetical protein